MTALEQIEARVGAFMAALDRAVAKGLAGRPISCSKGCAHCCYLPVEAGLGEAVWAAIRVYQWADWRHFAGTLTAHALEQTQRGYWGGEWFARHVPCPFLLGDGSCRIYDRRPVACRAHYVQSPPENCALGAENPQTRPYDAAIQAIPHAMKLDGGIHADYFPGDGGPFVGMFPHLVLFALSLVVEGGDRRWLDKRLSKLPHPREWTRRAVAEQIIPTGPLMWRRPR